MRWKSSLHGKETYNINNYSTPKSCLKKYIRIIRNMGLYKCFVMTCIVVLLVIMLLKFYSNGRTRANLVYNGASQNKYLIGELRGTGLNAGLGNVLFEMISFYAIARKTSRIPVIKDKKVIEKIKTKSKHFPNLQNIFTINNEHSNSSAPLEKWLNVCCKSLENHIKALQERTEETVKIRVLYAQSFKNFDGLSVDDIKNLTEASAEIKDLTGSLFKKQPEVDAHSLCVHIRRGDFVKQNYTYPSDAPFCQAATEYIMKKENIRVYNVYIFGNDQEFMDEAYLHMNVNVASVNKSRPNSIEFEFSKQYCDVVLMTAGISTYGWWLGYLSRGQRVYFNGNYTTPTSFMLNHLNPSDFFPPHWKPLNLNYTTNKIKESSIINLHHPVEQSTNTP